MLQIGKGKRPEGMGARGIFFQGWANYGSGDECPPAESRDGGGRGTKPSAEAELRVP